MNGVDRSDQYLAKYNLLRKCLRWWKTLFFHMIDISLVNAFILFQSFRKENPKSVPLKRANGYSVLEFREAVIRQILDLTEFGTPRDRCGYMDILAHQVPGGYGLDADVHVLLEHDWRVVTVAGSGLVTAGQTEYAAPTYRR